MAWNLDDATKAHVEATHKEALRLYKNAGDVEGALAFFIMGSGMLTQTATAEDIERARKALVGTEYENLPIQSV